MEPGMEAALAGLDAIDWATLEHAEGPAGDIPGLLRALGPPPECDCGCNREVWPLQVRLLDGDRLHPAATAAAPFLARIGRDPDCGSASASLDLLGRLAAGPGRRDGSPAWTRAWSLVVPALVPMLSDDDVDRQVRAAEILGAGVGDPRPTLDALLARLADGPSPPALVLAVGDLLGRAGDDPTLEEYRRWLVGLGAETDPSVAGHPDDRLIARIAVQRAGLHEWHQPAQFVDAFRALGEPLHRGRIRHLLTLVDGATMSVPDLAARLLAEPAAELRRGAIDAAADRLSTTRTDEAALLTLFGAGLADRDGEVRARSLSALTPFAPALATHADTVANLLDDPTPVAGRHPTTVADLALAALAAIGDPRAIPRIRAIIGDREPRWSTDLVALAPVAWAPQLIDVVRKRLLATKPFAVHEAATVCVAWRVAATTAVPELMAALRMELPPESVPEALGAIGVAARAAVPALYADIERHADDKPPARVAVTLAVAVALYRLVNDPVPLIAFATGLLADDYYARPALGHLAGLGHHGGPALPALRAMTPSPGLRLELAWTIARLADDLPPAIEATGRVLTDHSGPELPAGLIAAIGYAADAGRLAAPLVPALRRLAESADRLYAPQPGSTMPGGVAEDRRIRAMIDVVLGNAT